MSSILIIDDDELLCTMLCRYVRRMGHEAAFALTLQEGTEEVSSNEHDVVFLDVNLPDGNGLSAIPRIQETPCSPEIIIITGEGDADGAEAAIMSGAWAYLEKPPSMDNVTLQVTRALQYRQERRKSRPPAVLKREGIIGSSPALEASLDLVAQVASSEVNVLLTGETGVGKELFAQAVHKNSSRAGKSFVVVDCTVLPENLVESVLFGHEKGAFTGAEKTRGGVGQGGGRGHPFSG
jgi:two-component system NtrC family response regulator